MNPLKILIIDDEQLIRWSFEKKLSGKEFLIFTAETGEEGLRLFEMHFPDIVFVDNRLPGIQGLDVIKRIKSLYEDTIIVFMTAYGSIDIAVRAIKLGASEYISKPFDFKEIHILLQGIIEKIVLRNEIQLIRRPQRDKITFNHIIGKSVVIRKLVQEAKNIARFDTTTILLLGESGTGKDMFAKAIHNESSRSSKPFVTINCSSLSETLLESELFGHELGAFTDARKLKKGLFEIAEGGTIFLDEIGEINHSIQLKLLGVLENKTIKRVGGMTDIPVEIRIIAATNKNLAKSIEEKTFREDLYYRLKVFQITIPPLRDHREDIMDLSHHFLNLFNTQFGKKLQGIEHSVKEMLEHYPWPGNIRELRNVIERAVILEGSETLQKENLPSEIVQRLKEPDPEAHVSNPALLMNVDNLQDVGSLYDLEKQTIMQALDKVGFNQSKAARMLGVSRDTLRYKMKKYKL
jgi:two-component system, NtrC family, response regulator AtoC